MRTKAFLLFITILILFPLVSCSKGGDPVSPSDITPEAGLDPPALTLQLTPRDSTPSDLPYDSELTIALDPEGDSAQCNFTFGGTPVKGIEVRINDEIAAFTDENGDFEIPAIVEANHTISFGILGETFFSQPFSPVARFAQDVPEPGPGIMTGSVYDENGPVPGALVIVAKGDSYAYAFSGQYGQYYLEGSPAGNCLAAVLAEFHDPVFEAVQIPADGTPLEKDFYVPLNMSYGRIYGRVVSPGIGVVPYALVEYNAVGVYRADLSNIFGIFELEAIPVGSGFIQARHDYFYDVGGYIDVHAGLNAIGVIMHIIEQSTVHGQVVNAAGDPVNGVVVRLEIYELGGDYTAQYMKLSGPGGYFHFEDLLPGAYILKGFMPGAFPAYAWGNILPGSLIEETLVLYAGTGGHAFGYVINAFSEPVEGAIAILGYINADLNIASVTNEDGYWELQGIPYGACVIRIESPQYLPKSGYYEVLPDENEGLLAVVFPPVGLPTGSLGGTVFDSSSDVVPQTLVWVYNLANPDALSFMTLANDLGEYYFPNVIAGTNGGWAIKDGFLPDDAYIEITEGEHSVLNFELIPE